MTSKEQKNMILERSILIATAKKASKDAIRISRAKRLKIQFIKKGILVEQQPSGELVTVKSIAKVSPKLDGLKKGSVLCLK